MLGCAAGSFARYEANSSSDSMIVREHPISFGRYQRIMLLVEVQSTVKVRWGEMYYVVPPHWDQARSILFRVLRLIVEAWILDVIVSLTTFDEGIRIVP